MAVAAAQPAGSVVRLPLPHLELSTDRVLVMDRLRGVPVSDAGPVLDRLGINRADLAREILTTLLHQIVRDGVFHADPHAGNIFVLEDGNIGLLDLGSVGRLDASLRDSLQRLLIGFHHGNPLAVTDALLELVVRTEDVDRERLERDVGRLLARFGGGAGEGRAAQMFAGLFALVTTHSLEIPPEIAAVFRSMGTAEGTLRQLAPGFDLVATSRELARDLLVENLEPKALRDTVTDELVDLAPILRRLPRRIERIASAAEHGRFSTQVRLFADERERAFLKGVLDDVLVTGLAGVSGLMSVLLLGSNGGPEVRDGVGLHALIGYNLLVVSAILALRVLVQVFRRRR